MSADLHIHTTASDGRLSPADVVAHAIQAKLSCVAITDHDTVDGLLQLSKTKQSLPESFFIIPGIELSTELPDNDVHILGYYLDIFNAGLRQQLDLLIAHRHDRAKEIIAKLTQLGYAITYERVLELAGQVTSVGRPHIAKALVEKAYFTTVSDVFTTLLDKHGPAYVPHYKLTPTQVINLIKSAGGVPVLAHPGLVDNDAIVLEIINAGIAGLEVYHPTHDEEQTQKYLALANKHQLVITGGSDFHAIATRFPSKLGIFTIPIHLVCELEKVAKYKKS